VKGPLDIHRQLLAGDVPHEVVQLPRRISTAEELPDALDVLPQTCDVVHLLYADDTPWAVVLGAGATWSPIRLSRALRATRLRRAHPAETSVVTDYTPSLVSPLALPPSLSLLVDADFAAQDVIWVPTGETATAVRIRARDLLATTHALVDAVVDPCVIPLPAGDSGALPAHFSARAG